MSTISSREFNQDVGKAKRAARLEPVFITDRGRPSHVLLSFEAFRRISGETETIVDLLAMSDEAMSGGEPELDLDAASDGSGWDRREALK